MCCQILVTTRRYIIYTVFPPNEKQQLLSYESGLITQVDWNTGSLHCNMIIRNFVKFLITKVILSLVCSQDHCVHNILYNIPLPPSDIMGY